MMIFRPYAASFLAASSLLLALFAWHKVGGNLWAAWQTDEYSHGILIPLVALLLAWHRLTKTRPVPRPSWTGIPVLGVSGLMLLAGRLAAFDTAADYAFILALAGFSLAFLGTAATRALRPAFIYLIFAVPLPHLVYANLSQDLQLLSSTLGVRLLDLAGFSVFQEGNIIDLGGYRLQVVEACSGLRYLFPLMSFGFLIAYLMDDRFWKRALVFLSTIPITIGMNTLRIALVGMSVDLWGIQMAEGFLHAFEGWAIFLVCTTLLLAEVWALSHIGAPGRFRFEELGPAQGALLESPPPLMPSGIAAFFIVAIFAAMFGTGFVDERDEIIPTHPPFATFPLTPGDWRGRQAVLESDVLNQLQLSDYWLADYRKNGDSAPVNFFMAYYGSQRVGSAAHSPSNCIPGGGWRIVSKAEKTIVLKGGHTVTVSRLLIQRGDTTNLVYYWFDERGRNLTETYSAKWYLIRDSIAMHRTDGALIRLVTGVGRGETAETAETRLEDLLNTVYPTVKAFIPGGDP